MTTGDQHEERPPQRCVSDTSIGMCHCPQHPNGAIPEAGAVTIDVPRTENPGTTHIRPLAEPYAAKVGALVFDTLNGRVGVVMEKAGKSVFLRPERGGQEWETHPNWIDRPPAELSAKVKARNGGSRINSRLWAAS